MAKFRTLLLGLIAALPFFLSAPATAAPTNRALTLYAPEPVPRVPLGMSPVSLALPSRMLRVRHEPTRSFNPKFRDWTYRELEEGKSKFGLGGPIILLGIGAPLSIVAGYYMLWTLGAAFDPVPPCSGCAAEAVVWGAAAATGIGLGLWGSLSLGAGIKARGELNTETEMRDRVRRRAHRSRAPRSRHASVAISHGPLAIPLGFGWGAQGVF